MYRKNMCLIFVTLVMLFLLPGIVQADLIVDLDATLSSSVTVNGSGEVSTWADQSGSGNDATTTDGTVHYPSSYTSDTGLAGVDFTGGNNQMDILTSGQSDALLDFTGSATGGFSVMIAFKDEGESSTWTDLIGNTSTPTGFFIRYDDGGISLKFALNTAIAIGSVFDGDTVAVGLNYDATTGDYTCTYKSSSGGSATITGNVPAADFSTGNPLSIGNTVNNSRYLEGMIGEVKIYDDKRDSAEFDAEFQAMVNKWVEEEQPPAIPINDADLDGSGFIDIKDFAMLAGQWLDPNCNNFANLDETCGVDQGDLSVMSSKWLTKQPNIVMLFIDDWAWNGSPVPMDDSMNNSSMPLLQMPNLESMAADGMKFRNAYAAAPQCAPSRVSLQTGMTTARSGYTLVTGPPDENGLDSRERYAGLPVVPAGSDQGIDADATTIPEALRPHGYASAHFGKWHMYSSASAEGYIAHDGETTNDEGNTDVPGDPKLMFSITERAMDFMEEQVNAEKPFYVQVSHYAMHAGIECLPETRAKYEAILGSPDYADWYGMGEDLDGRIGAVLDKIEDLGIADNTYVIMVGDNGYRHGHYDDVSGLGQPLHSGKWWVWDGGLRVPMIVTGPDIPAGTVCTANVIHYDFLPTFVEWAGGDPTTELPDIDGVSLASLMRDETPTSDFLNRYLYFHCPHYREEIPASAIISGTDKLMYFYGTSVFMPTGFDPKMLFDLSTDKGEYHNITPTNPARAQQLSDELFQHLLVDTDAWMPLDPNPDYDPTTWENLLIENPEFDLWGPFEGTRPTEDDE